MSKPYDTTTKDLLETYPQDWLRYCGLTPDGPVQMIDADLATVPAEADKVCRVEGTSPYLIHFEMQASGDLTLARRLLRYHVLLDLRHDLRVRSVAVLLRPEADAGDLSGRLELRLPDASRVIEFHYHVIRAWRQSADTILAGSLGTLPLAPLADVPRSEIAGIIERIDARLVAEASVEEAGKIMQATLLLTGLRLEKPEIEGFRERLRTMNITMESSYYRLIIEEGEVKGRLEEARRIILRLGQIRFGPPEDSVRQAIEGLKDLDRLEQLSDRLVVVSSWAELMAESQESAS